MKIAVTSLGESLESPVDRRFGRSRFFVLYDLQSGAWIAHDNKPNAEAVQGAGIQAAQRVLALGAGAVITGHCGPRGFAALSAARIDVYQEASGSVQDVLDAYKAGVLSPSNRADVESGFGSVPDEKSTGTPVTRSKPETGPNVDMEHLMAMLNRIAEGVFTVDADKRITFFNRAAERITGFTSTEALGQPCQDIFRTAVCGERCILDEVRKTRKGVTERRVAMVDRHGRSLTVCVNAGALKDSRGRYVGGIETFRDVSTEEELRRRIEQSYTFQDIVSRHPRMHELFAILPDVAASQVPVLIEGASGTGKELLARAIHNLSERKDGRFMAVNCGALPDTLLEAELFGYRKGAFTDARTDRPGRFDAARGGTLFLDEIGNVSAAMQVRLLRALQEKAYEPLGSTETIRSDARIIATTNRPLADLIRAGTFRQDLYYRLNVLRLELPPLRDRRSDIPLLVEHFRHRLNAETGKNIERIAPEVFDALMRHAYPGNIRELENIMQHAFVLCRGTVIQPAHLPSDIAAVAESEHAPTPLTLKSLEKRAILDALRDHANNRSAAARQLGIDPSSLYRKMRRYGIE